MAAAHGRRISSKGSEMKATNMDLEALRSRKAPLDMGAAEFREVGHQLVEQIAGFLEGLPNSSVTAAESPEVIRAALDSARSLPESGADAGALVQNAAELLFSHSLFN